MAIAKAAGMKYLVFTSRHHDGFSEFDTQADDYKITSPDSPFHRDVVKELAAACHRAGLRFGLYYSQPNWHHPDAFTDRHTNYLAYLKTQVRELLTNYGTVDIFWFDGLGKSAKDYDAEALNRMIRQSAAAHPHQQPRRPARGFRHARAGNREVPVQPPLGELHHHLQPVGLEAGRPDEIPPAMPGNADPLRGRRRQPAVQRRPHARWPDRAAPGRAAGGNG